MKYLAAAFALALSACVTNSNLSPTENLAVSFGQACAGYSAALASATLANNAGKLTKAQVQAISAADAQISPLCTGPTPTDLNAAITQVTAATTTVVVEAAIKEQEK